MRPRPFLVNKKRAELMQQPDSRRFITAYFYIYSFFTTENIQTIILAEKCFHIQSKHRLTYISKIQINLLMRS
jgi:hypothetical protein